MTPSPVPDGPALKFDFPAFEVGVAEYDEVPTGCTVFHFPAGTALAVDVRGGSPAYVGDYGWTHVICLAGGSVYGLEAAAGVAAELFARRAFVTAWDELALVAGAIIYDFGVRQNAVYPDKALGQAALRNARAGRFPLGSRGAGVAATVGKGFDFDRGESAGQGGAIRQVGPTKVAVFSVVNAIGAVVDREGRVVRGHRDPTSGKRVPIADNVEALVRAEPGNTTLTVVVTNQRLGANTLRQLRRQVHASLARAIQPFHTIYTIYDGDVLFAVTTAEVENPALNEIALGVVASELAWDAVLSSFGDSGVRPS
jgi:L-aminopeptidase/D-esterase-like protein